MTKNEINMFVKAKEIQEGWKPEVGDRVWMKDTLDAHKDSKHFIIKRVGYDGLWQIGAMGFKTEAFYQDRLIFLPSIEQMAEMWREKALDERLPIFGLIYFWMTEQHGKSYFQDLWHTWPEHIIVLAFIQHELYGLTWSEEKGEWVDVNKS